MNEIAACLVILVKYRISLEGLVTFLRMDFGIKALPTKVNILGFVSQMASVTTVQPLPLSAYRQWQYVNK